MPIEIGCLHELFQAQASRTPERVAVLCGTEATTYAALESRANQLARHLRDSGVEPADRVAICLPRTADLIVGMLAVLKAGACYVPLDPAYPQPRNAFIAADSGARLVITDADLAQRFSDRVLIPAALPPVSSDRLESRAGPHDLAYIIYTSGSTGRPKGVAIEHRSAHILLQWVRQAFTDEELGGMLAATSVCFDLSIFEIFGPLSWGGQLILTPNVLALDGLDSATPVTLVNTVPSAMAELLSAGSLPTSVRTVCLAGEPLTAALARRVWAQPHVRRVCNLYGPSEDTTYSTWSEVDRDTEAPAIGRPLPRTRAYLLDEAGKPVPPGVPGELYLSGEKVARGYLNRPEETAARFLPDLFRPADRMYRTGDRCLLQPDGQLRYLGRLDDQVKLRGFRIELGEVEAALAACPGVEQAAAAVAPGPSGDLQLVGYLVGPGAEAEDHGREVLARLRATLPAHLVPSAVRWLDQLPRMPNGKLDRRALPPPLAAAGHPVPDGSDVHRAGPDGTVSQVIATVWSQVLGTPVFDEDQDFLELGGDSLLAVRCAARLRAALGRPVTAAMIFDHPVLRELTSVLSGAPTASTDPSPQPPPPEAVAVNGAAPLSSVQRAMWLAQQLEPDDTSYLLGFVIEIEAPLTPAQVAAALALLVARQPALRTVFDVQGGVPCQQVKDGVRPDYEESTRARGLTLEQQLRQLADQLLTVPMDLSTGPLLLARCVVDGPRRLGLLLVIHHIVCDGWSLGLIVSELARACAEVAGGLAHPPAALMAAPAPAGFAVAQRQWLASPAGQRASDELTAELRGAPTVLDIATRAPRSSTAHGAHLRRQIDPELAAAVRVLARRQRLSLYMVGLAAFAAVAGWESGQQDLLVGTAFAGRTAPAADECVGCFVNTLPLRLRPIADQPFADLLAQARAVALLTTEHQDVPLDLLVERLRPARQLGRNPLFQVAFGVFNGLAAECVTAAGHRFTGTELDRHSARLDLTLWLEDRGNGLDALWTYRTDLLEDVDVLRWHQRFELTLEQAASDQSRSLAHHRMRRLADV